MPLDALRPGDVRPGPSRRCRPGGRRDRRRRRVRRVDITGESRPVVRTTGRSGRGRHDATDSSVRVRRGRGRRHHACGIRRLVADAQASRSRAQALAIARLRSLLRRGRGRSRPPLWLALGEPDEALERTNARSWRSLALRPGTGDPTRATRSRRRSRRARGSSPRIVWRSNGCGRSMRCCWTRRARCRRGHRR